MLRLGIIGTNGISDQLVDALAPTAAYQFHSVLSRSQEKAEKFASKYGQDIVAYSELDRFLADEDLDIVYIATPNANHFEEAKAALKAQKHVIVEKPAFSNPAELAEIKALSQETGCYFFEAIRTLYNGGMTKIKDFIADKEVLGASLRFVARDYRMADVLAGGDPPSFSRKFSGGTLTDIGVYLLYPTLYLFGQAKTSFYQAKLLATGVDGNGVGILDYDAFQVEFYLGRNIQTYLPQSEIYLSDGTLVIDSFSNFEKLSWHPHDQEAIELNFEHKKNSMTDQCQLFADIIKTNNRVKFDEITALTSLVNQTMYEMRQSAGISFAADTKMTKN